MKWMRERDLLIAQTMAFVQSVTGRKPELDKPFPHADLPKVTPTRLPDIEAMLAETLAAPEAAKPAAVAPTVERMPELQLPPLPSVTSQPGLRSPYQNEIQARVANFRAHQQRFLKEREDYCAATMAKVQAALEKFPAPRQTGK